MAESHQHHHHHTHQVQLDHVNKAFIWSIVLNSVFLLIELIVGLVNDSLALLSDAGHNLGDVFSLLLALFAFKLTKVRPTARYTYGYRKSTVLVSLVNACILLVTVGVILIESIRKIANPQPVDGDTIAIVAAIGVVVNGFTAWLFMKDRKKDLNIKGAYLHLAADALVSLGVVVSGVIIRFTGWYIVDPLIGIGIAVVILISTWQLLSHSIRLSLDGVPPDIHLEELKKELLAEAPYLVDIHHIHVWALSTTQVAFTAHVILQEGVDWEIAKCSLKALLAQHGIQHVTLEPEAENTCVDMGPVW